LQLLVIQVDRNIQILIVVAQVRASRSAWFLVRRYSYEAIVLPKAFGVPEKLCQKEKKLEPRPWLGNMLLSSRCAKRKSDELGMD